MGPPALAPENYQKKKKPAGDLPTRTEKQTIEIQACIYLLHLSQNPILLKR